MTHNSCTLPASQVMTQHRKNIEMLMTRAQKIATDIATNTSATVAAEGAIVPEPEGGALRAPHTDTQVAKAPAAAVIPHAAATQAG